MGKRDNRLEEIINYLKENNGASVKDLANLLNVSEMTIRRDLKILDDSGIVNNVYGSTIYNPRNSTYTDIDDYSLSAAADKHKEAKEKIGQFAASLVNDEDTIILDAGTTTEAMAKYLNKNISLKILCTTVNVLNLLTDKKNFSITFPGGYYHHNTQMCESEESLALIEKTRANKVFISAAGIHEKLGVTCANSYETNTKKASIASGAEVILLADSSKFSTVKSAYFANLSDFNTIITDTEITPEWEEIIGELGIKLYKV